MATAVEPAKRRQNKPKKETVVFTTPQEKQNASFFPKIFRFITERWKLLLCCLVSGVIVVGIVLQGISLYHNVQEERRIDAERGETEKELVFWKESLKQYPNSRDIYFRIATLEYSLGNTYGAEENLKKALQIDPNFKKGREMEKQIRLK
jgi:tetratricopeptide (TPR) repeat protein